MVRSLAESDISHHCVGIFCCEGSINKQGSFRCLLATQLCESAGCCSKSILATRQLFNNYPERSVSNWPLQANFLSFSPELTVWCSSTLTIAGGCFSEFASESWTSLVSYWKSKNINLPLSAFVFLSYVMFFSSCSQSWTFVYWILCRNTLAYFLQNIHIAIVLLWVWGYSHPK